MKLKEAIIYYKGSVEDATLIQVSDYLRKRFPAAPTVTNKLFAIFVELAQNVSRYSAERNLLGEEEDTYGVGTIELRKQEEYYLLQAQNVATNEAAQYLKKRCDEINQLDLKGLKDLRRQIRSRPRTPDQRGGNIGLIQVAIRSGNPIEVTLKPLNGNSSYTRLQISSKVAIDK